MTTSKEFREVTKLRPCEVCGKPDWCRRNHNGAMECHRKKDDAVNGFKRVGLTGAEGFGVYRRPEDIRTTLPPSRSPAPNNGQGRKPRTFPSIGALAAANGKETTVYHYRSAAGADAMAVVRIDPADGRKRFVPAHPVAGGWAIGDPPGNLPLYRLPDLDGADAVFIVEGERCADRLAGLGLVVTTSSHGAGSPHRSDWSPLAGRNIVVLPDNDGPGREYADAVAGFCFKLDPKPRVKVVTLPGLPDKGDVIDFIDSNPDKTPDDIRATIAALADNAPEYVPVVPGLVTSPDVPFGIVAADAARRGRSFAVFVDGEPGTTETYQPGDGAERRKAAKRWAAQFDADPDAVALLLDQAERVKIDGGQSGGDDEREKLKQAELVINAARAAGLELFHTPDGVAYAAVALETRRHTCRVESRDFRNWLSRTAYEQYGKPASANGIIEAVTTLAGLAEYGDDTRSVFVRYAAIDDTRIAIDLADESGRYVLIDGNGWTVRNDEPPVRFVRPRGQRPLPVPVKGGSVGELRDLLNLTRAGDEPAVTDPDFILIVAFIVMAMRGDGPYPVLALKGEQGSAKSTAAKIIRSVFDPVEPSLRAAPRSTQDLIIAAQNSHGVALDNLSRVSGTLSDGLCRLSTGGGFGARKLYTDDEEAIFDVMRPILLNGINRLASRSDLADRAIEVSLPTIPDTERRRARSVDAMFAEAHPRILAAMLDAVAVGLKAGQVEIDRPPRMADFAAWIVGCEPGLPWPVGAFMSAYRDRIREANQAVIEDSGIARAVVRLAEAGPGWDGGSLTDMLAALCEITPEAARGDGWPKSARGLRNALERITPNLRRLGIELRKGRNTSGHSRTIIKLRSDPSDPSDPSVGVETPDIRPETAIRAEGYAEGSEGSTEGSDKAAAYPSGYPSAQNRDSGPETAVQGVSEGSEGSEGYIPGLNSTGDEYEIPENTDTAEWAAFCEGDARRLETADPARATRARAAARRYRAAATAEHAVRAAEGGEP